jgi:hypothetical protein
VTPDDVALALLSHATGLHQVWRANPATTDLRRGLSLLQDMLERTFLAP